MSDLFAPQGGWRVRIHDLSLPAENDAIDEIGPFETLMHANEFARRYVRASFETCRQAVGAGDVLQAWRSWGEDAEVVDAGEGGWKSADALAGFVAVTAGEEDCDWRALDPRRTNDADDGDADGDPGTS